MKSFLQYITEAGIRRKLRVLQSVENNPQSTRGERIIAGQDVDREQRRRTGRVLNRAKAEAEASEPPVTGGIYAHAERLERVGEKAGAYATQMAGAEKPGFARRRSTSLAPRGNDGY